MAMFGSEQRLFDMKTREEIEEKIKPLLLVVKEISARNDELDQKIVLAKNTEELEQLRPQFDVIQNQLVEITGNIWAFRWVLGEIDDIQFSVETATSTIEKQLG